MFLVLLLCKAMAHYHKSHSVPATVWGQLSCGFLAQTPPPCLAFHERAHRPTTTITLYTPPCHPTHHPPPQMHSPTTTITLYAPPCHPTHHHHCLTQRTCNWVMAAQLWVWGRSDGNTTTTMLLLTNHPSTPHCLQLLPITCTPATESWRLKTNFLSFCISIIFDSHFILAQVLYLWSIYPPQQ